MTFALNAIAQFAAQHGVPADRFVHEIIAFLKGVGSARGS